MPGWLSRRWHEACARHIGTAAFWDLAVDHRAAYAAIRPLIDRHARGVILDAGAGRLAWRAELLARGDAYIATDYGATHPGLDFLCDLQGGIPLEDGSVDTVFCCSVLEHVPDPRLVLPEFRRVLTPGGKVVLSVPFLYYLHGAPQDFFRFTPYGVVLLARAAGLSVLECHSGGGIGHALTHAASMFSAAVLAQGETPWMAARATAMLHGLGRAVDALDRGGLFAQSVHAVLLKE